MALTAHEHLIKRQFLSMSVYQIFRKLSMLNDLQVQTNDWGSLVLLPLLPKYMISRVQINQKETKCEGTESCFAASTNVLIKLIFVLQTYFQNSRLFNNIYVTRETMKCLRNIF